MINPDRQDSIARDIRETALTAREQEMTFSQIAQVLGKSMRSIQRRVNDDAISGKQHLRSEGTHLKA